jgi:hypothetical protein
MKQSFDFSAIRLDFKNSSCATIPHFLCIYVMSMAGHIHAVNNNYSGARMDSLKTLLSL